MDTVDTVGNLNLPVKLRNAEDWTGNGEYSVELVHVNPETGVETPLGVSLISNGMNKNRLRTCRRPGDAGADQFCLQDEDGRMIDVKS